MGWESGNMHFVKSIIWGNDRTESVNVVLILCIMYRNISPLPEENYCSVFRLVVLTWDLFV